MNDTEHRNRIKVFREFDDGTGIGEIQGIKNVNTKIYKEFKEISKLYGNNEGATLTACVLAWQQIPTNYQQIIDMREKQEEIKNRVPEEIEGEDNG